MKFEMVEELSHEEVAVNLACKTIDVSRSGYYAWLNRPESVRSIENQNLLSQILKVHEKTKQTYGSPRMTEELVEGGFTCSENRVAKLMRENKIASEAVRKFKVTTTDSKHDLPIAKRIFETENVEAVAAPNQVWVGDITYVATEEGFLFLSIFMDLFTRKIVGFSSDDNMRTELVLNALTMALGRQDINMWELIAHTDRGSQYAAEKYREKLNLIGIVASMSRKGNCWDNAHCESFFHTLKTELVYRTKFKTRQEAKDAIFEWIETWYNKERRHSALGYMSPAAYENLALAA